MAGEGENSIIDFEELNRTVESPKGIHGDKKAKILDYDDSESKKFKGNGKNGNTHK